MCDIAKLKIHRRCSTPTDPIVVFIQKENENVGLCNKCWGKVSASDYEWGDEPKIKPEDFKAWLEKGRGLEGAVLTEYDPSATGAKRHRTITEEGK